MPGSLGTEMSVLSDHVKQRRQAQVSAGYRTHTKPSTLAGWMCGAQEAAYPSE